MGLELGVRCWVRVWDLRLKELLPFRRLRVRDILGVECRPKGHEPNTRRTLLLTSSSALCLVPAALRLWRVALGRLLEAQKQIPLVFFSFTCERLSSRI